MLEKERFLAIKKLAKDIREDNKKKFEEFEDEPVEVAVRKKNDFIESIVNNMASAFSEGEQGKEEKQIFRANILIPDDEEFYDTYSKDKNIRNLMNRYSVNIEDIMSKITELNIYGKYIEEEDNTDEMVNISPKEAEDLLDEIDSLSNTLTNLDLNIKDYDLDSTEDDTPKFITPSTKPKKEKKEVKKEDPMKEEKQKEIMKKDEKEEDDFLGDSFDNINNALSGFVTDYNSIKEELKQNTKYISSLESNVKNLTNENDRLKDLNSKHKEENKTLKSENSDLKNELADLRNKNADLDKRTKTLEDKLYKSMALLKKVYTGIKD